MYAVARTLVCVLAQLDGLALYHQEMARQVHGQYSELILILDGLARRRSCDVLEYSEVAQVVLLQAWVGSNQCHFRAGGNRPWHGSFDAEMLVVRV